MRITAAPGVEMVLKMEPKRNELEVVLKMEPEKGRSYEYFICISLATITLTIYLKQNFMGMMISIFTYIEGLKSVKCMGMQ
jgi:hypothetical protein